MDQRTKMRAVSSHAVPEFVEAHRHEYEDLYQAYKEQGPVREKHTGAYFRSAALADLKKRYPEEWQERYYRAVGK